MGGREQQSCLGAAAWQASDLLDTEGKEEREQRDYILGNRQMGCLLKRVDMEVERGEVEEILKWNGLCDCMEARVWDGMTSGVYSLWASAASGEGAGIILTWLPACLSGREHQREDGCGCRCCCCLLYEWTKPGN